MIGADAVTDAANDPWVYKAVVIVAVLSVIGTAVMKGSSAWGKWLDDRRRAAEKRDDARVTGLLDDVQWLKDRDAEKGEKIAELESWQNEVRTRWGDHLVWDARAHALVSIHAPKEAADDLGRPPSILPGS